MFDPNKQKWIKRAWGVIAVVLAISMILLYSPGLLSGGY